MLQLLSVYATMKRSPAPPVGELPLLNVVLNVISLPAKAGSGAYVSGLIVGFASLKVIATQLVELASVLMVVSAEA
ncbi:MAG TPA: hypothetical protein VG298_02805 [Acidimicrobiales bacterium]|nr:hypothetical protein [Acidimicrobiales bacterium]